MTVEKIACDIGRQVDDEYGGNCTSVATFFFVPTSE
jgi:hypothetical protein